MAYWCILTNGTRSQIWIPIESFQLVPYHITSLNVQPHLIDWSPTILRTSPCSLRMWHRLLGRSPFDSDIFAPHVFLIESLVQSCCLLCFGWVDPKVFQPMGDFAHLWRHPLSIGRDKGLHGSSWDFQNHPNEWSWFRESNGFGVLGYPNSWKHLIYESNWIYMWIGWCKCLGW